VTIFGTPTPIEPNPLRVVKQGMDNSITAPSGASTTSDLLTVIAKTASAVVHAEAAAKIETPPLALGDANAKSAVPDYSSSSEEAPKRRRRTKAEMEAARAAALPSTPPPVNLPSPTKPEGVMQEVAKEAKPTRKEKGKDFGTYGPPSAHRDAEVQPLPPREDEAKIEPDSDVSKKSGQSDPAPADSTILLASTLERDVGDLFVRLLKASHVDFSRALLSGLMEEADRVLATLRLQHEVFTPEAQDLESATNDAPAASTPTTPAILTERSS
jgi:hypothetical protein